MEDVVRLHAWISNRRTLNFGRMDVSARKHALFWLHAKVYVCVLQHVLQTALAFALDNGWSETWFLEHFVSERLYPSLSSWVSVAGVLADP
jgi:hypothetical protein